MERHLGAFPALVSMSDRIPALERVFVNRNFLEQGIWSVVRESCPFASFVLTDAKPTTVAGCNWDTEFRGGPCDTGDPSAHAHRQFFTNILRTEHVPIFRIPPQ